jgi:hypothetical protein
MSVLRLTSYPLRDPFGYLAAAYVVGGLVSMGVLLGTALASHNFWLQILSLSALVVIALVLVVLLFRKGRQSRMSSQYCPSCIIEITERQSLRPEEFMPHKVALKKGK